MATDSILAGLNEEETQQLVLAALTTLVTRSQAAGQATAENSAPVVLPASQLATVASEATALHQDDLLQDLRDALEFLGILGAARATTGELRVVLGNGGLASNIGTVSAVTTVGTLSQLGAFGAYRVDNMPAAAMNQAAILSNINNIVVT